MTLSILEFRVFHVFRVFRGQKHDRIFTADSTDTTDESQRLLNDCSTPVNTVLAEEARHVSDHSHFRGCTPQIITFPNCIPAAEKGPNKSPGN